MLNCCTHYQTATSIPNEAPNNLPISIYKYSFKQRSHVLVDSRNSLSSPAHSNGRQLAANRFDRESRLDMNKITK